MAVCKRLGVFVYMLSYLVPIVTPEVFSSIASMKTLVHNEQHVLPLLANAIKNGHPLQEELKR